MRAGGQRHIVVKKSKFRTFTRVLTDVNQAEELPCDGDRYRRARLESNILKETESG